MQLLTPAKVNLNLSVAPLEAGSLFHNVETVLCQLALTDSICIECTPQDPSITCTCEPDPLPKGILGAGQANIAWRAAKVMQDEFKESCGCRIQIKKSIPSQAGLGGGSSDAAAVIRLLADAWSIPCRDSRVLRVAASLGADVPFFLYDSPAHMTGRGDILQELLPAFETPLVLVKPPVGVSTKLAYEAFDAMNVPASSLEPLLEALRDGNIPKALLNCANNLAPASKVVQPALVEVERFLANQENTYAQPLLCGSGSCWALFTYSLDDAQRIAREAQSRGWWASATHTGC